MVQGYRNIGVQGNRNTSLGIQQYKNTVKQGYMDTRIQDTGVQESMATGIQLGVYRDKGIQRYGILDKVCLT